MRRLAASAWQRLTDTGRYVGADPVRVAIVLAAFAAGLLSGVPVGDAGFTYTWRRAEFCDDCHVHDYANEAYFRSVHAGVTTCHDCHRVPVMHYPRNLFNTLVYGPREPGEMRTPHVASVLCEACHADGTHEPLTGPMDDTTRVRVVKIDQSPLHSVHLDAEVRDPGRGRGAPTDLAGVGEPETRDGEVRTIACLDCHGHGDAESHRFEAARHSCEPCHAEASPVGGRLDALKCQECHRDGFMGRRPALE